MGTGYVRTVFSCSWYHVGRRGGRDDGGTGVAGKAVRSPAAARFTRILAAGSATGGLESAGSGGGAGLTPKAELLDRLRAEIAYVEVMSGVRVDPALVNALAAQADHGLDRILADGEDAELTEEELSGLEAVVKTDGSRPVLFAHDDFVDVMAPSIGAYASRFSQHEDAVRAVCRAAGRVDDPTAQLGYQGTAFLIADDLVLTNYHVLEVIAPGCTRENGQFQGTLKNRVAVHFGREVKHERPDRSFPVKRVVQVGAPGRDEFYDAGTGLNLSSLDFAVLQLEKVPGRFLPRPLPVARGDDPATMGGLSVKGRGVYVVGFPGNEHSTTPDLFSKIFAGVKSFKRVAPGAIMDAAGSLAKDPEGWVMTHDASTLGGNSGSCVLDFEADAKVVLGLHFAGLHQQQNWAHAFEQMADRLGDALPKPAWRA